MQIKVSAALIVLLFIMRFAYGQNGQRSIVFGSIADSISNVELKNATISVFDKTKRYVFTSKDDGSFYIDKLQKGQYELQFSFVGYKPQKRLVEITDTERSLNLGKILLSLNVTQLNTVAIKDARPPIVIRKDTIEYNTDRYSQQANYAIADLLRKLPGLQIDQNGTVTSQGTAIDRVLVDGKPFFGDNKKLALQNLPAEIADKIQVYDGLSDRSNFTGVDDGEHTKTLNIVTKKTKRNGYFGKLKLGLSNNDLYNVNANVNAFNETQRISVTGQSNNGNFNNTMAGGFPSSNNTGFLKNTSAGINISQVINKKTSIDGSYYFENNNQSINQQFLTQYFSTVNTLPQVNKKNNNSKLLSNSHQLNLNLTSNIDSNNSLLIRSNILYSNKNQIISNNEIVDNTKSLISNAKTESDVSGNNLNAVINVLFTHKFNKKGRTLTFNGSLNSRLSINNNRYNNSLYNYTNMITDSTNQFSKERSPSYNWAGFIAFTEPLSKNSLIEFRLTNTVVNSTSAKNTYNYNLITGEYTNLDTLLSNNFQSTNRSSVLGINYQYSSNKFNINAGIGFQADNLSSINVSKNIALSQSFLNAAPIASINYHLTNNKNIQFNYQGRTSEPDLEQLQPITDKSDPLFIIKGNPNLKQTFVNALRFSYSASNPKNYSHLFISIQGNLISNQIVNSVTIFDNGVQQNEPININGNFNTSGYINYGLSFKNPNIDLNYSTNFAHSINKTVINGTVNNESSYTIGQTIGINYNVGSILDLTLNGTPSYNVVKSSSNYLSTNQYFSTIISTYASLINKNGWLIASSFNYVYNRGISTDFNGSIPLWNISLGRQLLKNKQLETKLLIFDVLNQNKNIYRVSAVNYIQDVQNNVQKRFFMFSLTYNLKSFKQK